MPRLWVHAAPRQVETGSVRERDRLTRKAAPARTPFRLLNAAYALLTSVRLPGRRIAGAGMPAQCAAAAARRLHPRFMKSSNDRRLAGLDDADRDDLAVLQREDRDLGVLAVALLVELDRGRWRRCT